jgi:hypothetical protein
MVRVNRKHRAEPLSEWMECVVRLPRGIASVPGPLKLHPYQRAIADAPQPTPWFFELMGEQFDEMIKGFAKLAALELSHDNCIGTHIANNACWQNTRGHDWCGKFEAKETPPPEGAR